MSGRHARDDEAPTNKRCICTPYPCDKGTCSWRCPVCLVTGPVLGRGEAEWRNSGEGLSEQEVERLRKSKGKHPPSGRKAREREETDG